LLERAGAEFTQQNSRVETVWDLLTEHIRYIVEEEGGVHDHAAFTSLLRVMVLHGDPPPMLVALLSPELARMVQEGSRLRVRLPAYLVRRRAVLDAHCPLLLPPLRALVHGYMELTTTDECWATGLGKVPIGSDLADW
jgi:hypothetical protein